MQIPKSIYDEPREAPPQTPSTAPATEPPRPSFVPQSIYDDPSQDPRVAPDRLGQTLTARPPDRAARLLELTRKTGIPVPLIERNFDALDKRDRGEAFDVQLLRRRAPEIVRWLEANGEVAPLAADDLVALGDAESSIQILGTLRSAWDTVEQFTGASLEAVGEFTGFERLEDYGEDVRIRNAAEAAAGPRRLSLTGGDVRDAHGLAKWATEGLVSNMPQIAISWGSVAAGAAIGSAILPVGGTVIGGLIGAIPGFALSLGEVQSDAKAYDPNAEAGLGMFAGASAIAALDSRLPFKIGAKLSVLLGRKAAERAVARALTQPVRSSMLVGTLREGVTAFKSEAITEALQKAIADVTVSATTGKPFDAKQTALDMVEEGLLGGLVGGTMGAGVHATLGHAAQNRLVTVAEQNKRAMEALGKATQASAAAKRSDTAVAEMLQQAGAANGVDTVYLPIETFSEYWQKEGLIPELVADELTGEQGSLARAQEAGLPNLAVPLGRYATRIAGAAEQKHHRFFLDEFRLDPAQANDRETREQAATLEKDLDALMEGDTIATQSPQVQIAADLLQKITDAGGSTLEAKHYAALIATRAVERGRRRGVDPVALYRSQPLNFRITDKAGRDIVVKAGRTATPGVVDIPASRAAAGETREARRTRVTAHRTALTQAVVIAAQQLDPAIDADLLARELALRLDIKQDAIAEGLASGQDPIQLLRDVVATGGFDTAHGGEFDVVTDGTSFGTVNGVAGVFRRGGLTVDGVLEALQQKGGYAHLDYNGLIEAINLASRPDTAGGRGLVNEVPGTAELAELGIDLSTKWWEGDLWTADPSLREDDDVDESPTDEGDDSFNVDELEHRDDAWDVALPPRRVVSTRRAALAVARALQGQPITNSRSGRRGMLTRDGIGKMLGHDDAVAESSAPADHFLAVANLDQLFERAVWNEPESAPPTDAVDNTIIAFHRFYAPLRVRDGSVRLVKITAKEVGPGQQPELGDRLYAIQAIEVGSAAIAGADAASASAGADVPSADDRESISGSAPPVNEAGKREGTLQRPPSRFAEPVQSLLDAIRAFNAGARGELFQLSERNTPDGFEVVAPHLTTAEKAKLRADTAQALLDTFQSLPPDTDWEAVAIAGQAKKGWYERSTKALRAVFGMVDSVRVAALLAALSPQTSVEQNLRNTLRLWRQWTQAGRPTDRETILALLAQSVSGAGEASVLDSWRNNVVTALTTEDALTIVLSGPKVQSFAMNLWGYVQEVTTDAWMVTFTALEEGVLGSGARNVAGTDPGKTPGYLAFSAKVRRVAQTLTRRTGERWTPANVQETVWSWAKTLYELADAEATTAEAVLKSGRLTDAAIASAPDFATLFTADADIRAILENAGYAEPLRAFAQAAARGHARRPGRDHGGPGSAGAGAGGRGRLSPSLLRAARRLDTVRTRRQTDAAARKRAKLKAAREKLKAAAARAQARRTRGELAQRDDVADDPTAGELQQLEGFYSRIERAIDASTQGKATGAQWKATLRNAGVDLEEFRALAIDALEDSRVYTREALTQHLADHRIDVQVVTLTEQPFTERQVADLADTLYTEALNARVAELEDKPDAGPRLLTDEDLDYVEDGGEWTVYLDDNVVAVGETEEAARREAATWLEGENDALEHEFHEDLRAAAARALHYSDFETEAREQLEGDTQADRAEFTSKTSALTTVGADPGSPREVFLTAPRIGIDGTDNRMLWTDGHGFYDNRPQLENPIVRIRFHTRTETDGSTTLFVDEVQHPEQSVFATMPELFQKHWLDLAWKWTLRHAAVNGYTRVAWTTGAMQAERYRLRKHVDRIVYYPASKQLAGYRSDARGTHEEFRRYDVDPQDLAKYVGQARAAHMRANQQSAVGPTWSWVELPAGENPWALYRDGVMYDRFATRAALEARLAEWDEKTRRYAEQNPEWVIEGADLEIGGEGLIKLYGTDVPRVVGKLLKKSGGTIGTHQLDVQGRPEQGTGVFTKYEYVGPELTREELAAFVEQGAPRTDYYVLQQLRDAEWAMSRGASFADTMAVQSIAAAEAVGGELRELPEVRVPVPSVELTAAVREHFTKDQALYHADTRDDGTILRGGFNRYTRTIRLIAGAANLSTFVHESAHLFLEELVEDALAVEEGHQLRADAQRALAFAGFQGTLEEWAALASQDELPQHVIDAHEAWAEAFVEYLHAGKAPTPELQSLFSTFRAWLVAVYRTLTGRGIEVPADVRALMDRLLASDEAIARAERERNLQPLFSTSDSAGVDPLEFAAYEDEMRKGAEEARRELDALVMADWRRTQSAEWKVRREAVEREVRAEANQTPAFVAQSVIRTGKMPDGSTPSFSDGSPLKLSKDAIVSEFGLEMVRRLPRPVLYTVTGGAQPAAVAQLTGFPSAQALLEALIDAPRLNAWVAHETDRRMRDTYGDKLLDGISLAEAAKSAVLEQRRQVVSRELAMLSKGMAEAIIPATRELRAQAERAVASLRVRALHPAQYRAAAARASQQGFEAWKRNDRRGAIEAKRKELRMLELYRAARAAQERTDQIQRRMQQLSTSQPLRGRLAKAGFLEHIDAALERYEFTRISQKAIQRKQSLRVYLAELAAKGVPTDHIPDEVQDDARRINWRELTVEELIGVADGVEMLAHLGRLKDKLLTAQSKRDLEQLQADLSASVEDHGPKVKDRSIEPRHPDERGKRSRHGWVLGHRTLSSLIFEMDGFTHGGPMWQFVMRPINEALDRKATMMAEATKNFVTDLNTHYDGAEQLAMAKKQWIPKLGRADQAGANLSKMATLMVALNYGNATNRQRLRDGYGWSEDQVKAILDTLDQRDWQWVVKVWQAIDSYWPATEEKMKRISGIAAPKVQAEPFVNKFGDMMPGGYFPIMFEGALSPIAAAHENAGIGLLHQNTAYMATTVKRNHEKLRAEGNVTRAVRLDFGVITEHLNQVIHAVALHETIIDVGRILHADGELADTIARVHGDKAYETMRKTLQFVAVGEQQEYRDIDRFVDTMRRGSQVVGLGLNFTTPLLQVAGLGNVMARVGALRTLGAALRVAGDLTRGGKLLRAIRAESEFMRNRPRTINREIHEFSQRVGLNQNQFEVTLDSVTRTVFRNKKTYSDVQRSFFSMITGMQSLVDAVAYVAARDQALGLGHDEATARQIGDQVVRDTQASGESAYQAEVLRGSAWQKLFTTFFGPMLATYNLWTEQMHKGRRDVGKGGSTLKAGGELAAQFAFLFLVGPAIITFARELSKGDLGDDDDPQRYLWEIAIAMAGTTLLFRDAAQAAGSVYGYEGPPGMRPIATAADTAQRVGRAWSDEDYAELTKEAARGGFTIGGAFLHLPTGAAMRAWRAYDAWVEGDLEVNVIQAMLFGYDREGYGE